jgi:hypothetical protein
MPTDPPNRFVYELHYGANLPWVYGGEYEQITELVTTIVNAWISVGLRPIFIFDGSPSHLILLLKDIFHPLLFERRLPCPQVHNRRRSHPSFRNPSTAALLQNITRITLHTTLPAREPHSPTAIRHSVSPRTARHRTLDSGVGSPFRRRRGRPVRRRSGGTCRRIRRWE